MVSTAGHDDDDLLTRFAAGDPEAFVAFYRRHLGAVLGFFLRRTGDPELTADLTAEVFAAALLAVERYRAGERPALAWLYGIAAHKLADSRRRGRVEDEARRRLALAPLTVDDAELARVQEMADPGAAQAACTPCPRASATRCSRGSSTNGHTPRSPPRCGARSYWCVSASVADCARCAPR